MGKQTVTANLQKLKTLCSILTSTSMLWMSYNNLLTGSYTLHKRKFRANVPVYSYVLN